MRRDLRNSHHLATISHDGRFWDAYLELDEPRGAGEPTRGRIAFSAAGQAQTDPVRTATIFMESTPQEVVDRAREFKTHQLVALLRSCAPETAESETAEPEAAGPETPEPEAAEPEAAGPEAAGPEAAGPQAGKGAANDDEPAKGEGRAGRPKDMGRDTL